jgi:hypothetical protein
VARKLSREEKYRLYEASVQNPEADINFINKEYKKMFNRAPLIIREDFCGTGVMACEWVKQSKEHKAFGIDLDIEPITYGVDHHYLTMTEEQQKRMRYIKGNVLDNYDFKPDVIVAFNFSYFLFKQRNDLVKYFSKVKSHLGSDGVFFLDLFGGTDSRKEIEESNRHKNHTYYWECDRYNPLTADCLYYIHFKDHKTKVKHEKVFVYDWRMWDAKEIQDVLSDAGFSNIQIYWEGVDKNGEGDSKFKPTTKADNCESWVTYISARP